MEADASAALQSSTDRHQQLKMAPIHQTREERAPASEHPRPLLCVLIHPPHPFRTSQLPRGAYLPITEVIGFTLSPNKTSHSQRTSVPTKTLLDVPQNSQYFRRATFEGPHYRMGRETAVRAEGAGVRGTAGHELRRVIKTGISAEKRINIKVFPYSSMRRELLVIEREHVGPSH